MNEAHWDDTHARLLCLISFINCLGIGTCTIVMDEYGVWVGEWRGGVCDGWMDEVFPVWVVEVQCLCEWRGYVCIGSVMSGEVKWSTYLCVCLADSCGEVLEKRTI